MKTVLENRGGSLAEGSPLATAFENHCDSCHTTCGQCHISRPTTLGGGLLSGHKVKAVPSMTDGCSGCHGARVAAEYFGKNEGIPGDLHWTKQGMTCFTCHGEQEIHGEGQTPEGRYHQESSPDCRDCHADIASSNPQHSLHIDKLACQVCHSVDYKNCFNCHVNLDKNGTPYFNTDASVMEFKVGLNPIQSADRPEQYAVLRHAPIAPDTFSVYGDNLLPDFDMVSTWKYTTPHNIQLITPQNETCNNCHGNEDLFLSEADLTAEEREANLNLIPQVPALK